MCRVLGVPVKFDADGTWEVDVSNQTLAQVGSLYLVTALKFIDWIERVTCVSLPVQVQSRTSPDDPPYPGIAVHRL